MPALPPSSPIESGRLRLPTFSGPVGDLFAVRPMGRVPRELVAFAVVAGFVGTVLLTYAEYRAKGTSFGFSGPAFNMLVNPIYEELIFRGWILGSVTRHYRSNRAGIVVSSVLFGLLHLRNLYWLDTPALLGQMAYTGLVFGPAMAWVTLRCRSVWPAVVLHYANNLTYYLR